MTQIYAMAEVEIISFVLVLLRISAFVVSWPIFGSPVMAAPLKILFALTVSICCFSQLNVSPISIDEVGLGLLWLALKEVIVGVLVGFFARLFFFAVQIGAELAATSIGLASAQLYNPSLGQQTTVIEQLKVSLASLFFLGLNGHHLLIVGLMDSFRLLPPERAFLKPEAFQNLGQLLQEVVEIGLKVSAPVLVALLLVNLAMAVMGRAVPQINVLITSLPVNILVGLFIMLVGFPLLLMQMSEMTEWGIHRLFQLLRAI